MALKQFEHRGGEEGKGPRKKKEKERRRRSSTTPKKAPRQT